MGPDLEPTLCYSVPYEKLRNHSTEHISFRSWTKKHKLLASYVNSQRHSLLTIPQPASTG